jgi:hypothetical protein
VTGTLVALVLASSWSLSVRRDERALGCPDETRLRRSITERLGKDPFLDAAPTPAEPQPEDELPNPFAPKKSPATSSPQHRTLLVQFAREPQRYTAQVSLVDLNGTQTGSRELSSTASDCGELAGAVVLAAAIVIDPMVTTRAPVMRVEDAGVTDEWAAPPFSRPPDAPRPPPVLPVLPAARPPVQPPRPSPQSPITKPEPPKLNAVFIGLGGGVSLGQVPDVAALAQVLGSWGTRNSLLTARFGTTTVGGVTVGRGGVRAVLLNAGLDGCVKWSVFGVCVGADVGSVQAWALDLPNPKPQGALFLGLGAGALLDVPAGDLVRVRLQVTGLVQPRLTLTVGRVPVWQSSQFAFTAALTLHFKAWGDVLR